MSGPIVRKYGFPNFEKIFGERDLKHGVDEDEAAPPEAAEAPASEPTGSTKAKPKSPKKPAKKKG